MYRFQSGIIINGPIESNGDQGTTGEVLTSAGAGAAPTWGPATPTFDVDGLDAELNGANITSLTATDPIIFDLVNDDPAGSYDDTTGIFTCAYTGYYSVCATVNLTIAGGSPFAHQTQIRVDNIVYASQSTEFANGTTYCSSCSFIAKLTAGDEIKVCLNETLGSGAGTGVSLLASSATRLGIYYIER